MEVEVGIPYRGFSIRQFVWVHKVFQVDDCYCPDPDDGGRIPGYWELVINRLYRAVRVKNGEEFARGYSFDECKAQIDMNIGYKKDPIPF